MTREEEFFDVAAALPAAQRSAYLDAACAGQPELRAKVEALLRSREITAFMENREAGAIPEVDLAPLHSEESGERIGRYKLLQKLGEGGFGSVWMAEQMEPVSRRVALKIIKMGMDTREVIARFEAERQALAMMDHPNIARVLDAGATDKGRPFFVMELVNGIPITQFCDEREYGVRQRVALFADVCLAINHAHQKGVIHRDIKPSNVMVTLQGDEPVAKVIDFGIAKATQGRLTGETLSTRFEQFLGTPAYMSPEQTALTGLDIDTRSDIYALGILLYELLTGKPPFDAKALVAAGYEEMRHIIREVEPPRPSARLSTVAGQERDELAKARHIAPEQLSRMVEPDLDSIVMKAIEKDRTRRYATANGFATDIQRFLSDEPVSATPPGAGYRFRKFARRHKLALRVTVGITAVLIAATAVSTWQAVRAMRAEQVASERLKDAEAVSFFLSEMFQSLDPARDGRTVTVVELLKRAAANLDTNFVEQPERRAKLQGVLGRTYHSLGLYKEAIPLLVKSRDYCLAALGREHADTLAAMHDLAHSWHADGSRLEALALRKEVLELRRKVLGREHRDTLRSMASTARSLHVAGRLQDALTMQEEAATLSQNVLGAEDPDTLLAMHELALARYWARGLSNEELNKQLEVLAISRKVRGPKHPDTLEIMHDVAHFLEGADRHAETFELRREELALRREVNPEHSETLHSEADLAKSWHDAGNSREALRLQEDVLTQYRRVLGASHPDTLLEAANLAYFHLWAGRPDEAQPLLEELNAARNRSTLLSLKLTALHAWRGRGTDHAAICRQVISQATESQVPSAAERAAKGYCLLPSTDPSLLAEALKLARRAVALGKNDPYSHWFYMALGMAEYRDGNYPAADKALSTAEQAGPDRPLIQGPSRLFHAMSLFRQGKEIEARQLFAAAVAQMETPPAADQPFKKRADHDDLIFWLAHKEACALLQPNEGHQ